MLVNECALSGNLACPVAVPVNSSAARFPLVANVVIELGLGETWRQPANDYLETRSFGFGWGNGRRSIDGGLFLKGCGWHR